MIDDPLSSKLLQALAILTILGCVTACTGISQKQQAPFDPALVNGMQFQLSNATLFGTTLPEQEIADGVTANLSEWGYAIEANHSAPHSHLLTVELGAIVHGATPVGFSFSAGNSDPRALDFQKSDVLPINCILMPEAQTQHRAELNMGFVVEDYLRHQKAGSDQTKLVELLQNDISTVCFNLLSELKVPTLAGDTPKTQSKPTWIPEIRLEIDNETDATATPAAQSVSTDSAPTTAIQKTAEPRKRIIIHNQGSPVIFKFGHERK